MRKKRSVSEMIIVKCNGKFIYAVIDGMLVTDEDMLSHCSK